MYTSKWYRWLISLLQGMQFIKVSIANINFSRPHQLICLKWGHQIGKLHSYWILVYHWDDQKVRFMYTTPVDINMIVFWTRPVAFSKSQSMPNLLLFGFESWYFLLFDTSPTAMTCQKRHWSNVLYGLQSEVAIRCLWTINRDPHTAICFGMLGLSGSLHRNMQMIPG